jgi:hypothetical protein
MAMKRMVLLVVVLLLSTGTDFARPTVQVANSIPSLTTQSWTAGWTYFSEPLNFTKSKITWSVSAPTHKLTVTFTLVGATHSKLYQVGINFFCTTFPPTFGQFPVAGLGSGGTCTATTGQGVTKTVAVVELGVVTTDIHGNGSFAVVVGPIAAGTYNLEFQARDGAGCNLIGGAGNGSDCGDDFQSPGPIFGMGTMITVP